MLKVEVELTTNCQASCPMCSRNINGGLPNPHLHNLEWTYEEFKTVFTEDFLSNISTITFCGVFGDPLLCRDIKEIVKYLKDFDKELIIHTNGSIRTSEWWQSFAKVMPKKHRVIFGVDGLEDTHKYYRIGTDFNKIVDNIKAFNKANGQAQVQFLEFDHNKHQYEKLHKFFADINVHFFKQHTTRFRNKFHNVVDKNGTILYHLKPTKKSEIESYYDSDIPLAITASIGKSVCCASLEFQSVYIDSQKRIWPCCETASIEYTAIRLNEPEFNKILPTLKKQNKNIEKELGTISLLEKPALEILSNEYWKIWHRHWHSNTSLLCKLVCGKSIS